MVSLKEGADGAFEAEDGCGYGVRRFKWEETLKALLQPSFTCALCVNVDRCAKQSECDYEKAL